VYVAPVDTQYLNKHQAADGSWVLGNKISDKDITAMADFLRQSFIEAIKKNPETNLIVIDQPDKDSFTLALAITELTPTSVAVNALADVGGFLVPGAKPLAEAGAVGAQAIGGEIAGGSISFEMKFIDNNSGDVLAQAADREFDRTSIIPNYRDFSEYGWSRKTCKDWADQFVKLFDTTENVAVDSASGFSLLPW
jgi:hypothetical protein